MGTAGRLVGLAAVYLGTLMAGLDVGRALVVTVASSVLGSGKLFSTMPSMIFTCSSSGFVEIFDLRTSTSILLRSLLVTICSCEETRRDGAGWEGVLHCPW